MSKPINNAVEKMFCGQFENVVDMALRVCAERRMFADVDDAVLYAQSKIQSGKLADALLAMIWVSTECGGDLGGELVELINGLGE